MFTRSHPRPPPSPRACSPGANHLVHVAGTHRFGCRQTTSRNGGASWLGRPSPPLQNYTRGIFLMPPPAANAKACGRNTILLPFGTLFIQVVPPLYVPRPELSHSRSSRLSTCHSPIQPSQPPRPSAHQTLPGGSSDAGPSFPRERQGAVAWAPTWRQPGSPQALSLRPQVRATRLRRIPMRVQMSSSPPTSSLIVSFPRPGQRRIPHLVIVVIPVIPS